MSSSERTNDPSIPDEEYLWRRFLPKDDDLSKSDFKDSRGPTSVNLASLTSINKTLEGHPTFKIAQLTAGDVRSVGCGVVRNPTPDNSAHALIIGNHRNNNTGSKTGRVTQSEARKLSMLAKKIT